MEVEGNRNFEAGQKFQMAAELILGDKNLNTHKISDHLLSIATDMI